MRDAFWGVNIKCIYRHTKSASKVQLICSNQEIKMSIENRAEAVAKNLEGKVQEAVGEITGNTKDKVEGQAKQDEAAFMHAKEDIKDKAKDVIDKAY
jgi:uncharacterized protein YjbJ (UPF0337 family)